MRRPIPFGMTSWLRGLILIAATVHLGWAVMLLIDTPSVSRLTAIVAMDYLMIPKWSRPPILILAAALALYVFAQHGARPKLYHLILLVPQQVLLLLSFWQRVLAIMGSSFAIDVELPRLFIAANYLPMMTIATLHTVAMLSFMRQPHWKGRNG